jgi:FkbM family methyltransferase
MQHFGDKTYSQSGQDIMLLNIFKLLKIESPTYLDLGAHHPTQISNTALLVERLKAKGVNVDAHPQAIQFFKQQRPKDINVCLGVGPTRGKLNFYIWDDTSAINTFDKERAQRWIECGHRVSVTQVEVVTLQDILDMYCDGKYPDLLLMDIEGLDHAVLESADFSVTKPKVIVAEIEQNQQNTVDLMFSKGFIPLVRMVSDLIFVDMEYEDRLRS